MSNLCMHNLCHGGLTFSARLDWAYCACFEFQVFFFFPARMNSNCTVHVHGFTVQRQGELFIHCSHIIHRTHNHFI